MSKGIFDLHTPLEFFNSIRRILERYKLRKAKDIEDLLYVIMGLNHLREWIAPRYDTRSIPKNSNERFSKAIYDTSSHNIIRSLCNCTKHLKSTSKKTNSKHGIFFDEWPDVNSLRNFDLGPASDYFVHGENIIKIIDEVVEFYQNNWFNKP